MPHQSQSALLTRTTQAILFGSIGTLVETSDMQRRAFNSAFREAGLDWHWDVDSYAQMLKSSGGKARIATFAAQRGETVDTAALHSRKTVFFNAAVLREGLFLRPGVLETIDMARATGLKLGFITTTSRANIDAIFGALHEDIDIETFDLVTNAKTVANSKPAPDVYLHALDHFDLAPTEALAIEDTDISRQAAVAAGIPCNDFPGAFTLRAGTLMEPVDRDRLVVTQPPFTSASLARTRARAAQSAPPFPGG